MTTVLGAATIFPFRPDAGEPMKLTPAYLTSVQTPKGGPEVRAMLRETPVRKFEFTIALYKTQLVNSFLSLWLASPQRQRIQVPD
jgi:hypothetical protein